MEEGLALCAYIITREYQLNINRIYVLKNLTIFSSRKRTADSRKSADFPGGILTIGIVFSVRGTEKTKFTAHVAEFDFTGRSAETV